MLLTSFNIAELVKINHNVVLHVKTGCIQPSLYVPCANWSDLQKKRAAQASYKLAHHKQSNSVCL